LFGCRGVGDAVNAYFHLYINERHNSKFWGWRKGLGGAGRSAFWKNIASYTSPISNYTSKLTDKRTKIPFLTDSQLHLFNHDTLIRYYL